MSTSGAFGVVAALLAFSLAAAYWQIDRARRHEAMRDRIIRAANEHAEAAREVDDLELLYSLPAFDPAWEAGRERLWDAIRDDQNDPRGDQ